MLNIPATIRFSERFLLSSVILGHVSGVNSTRCVKRRMSGYCIFCVNLARFCPPYDKNSPLSLHDMTAPEAVNVINIT